MAGRGIKGPEDHETAQRIELEVDEYQRELTAAIIAESPLKSAAAKQHLATALVVAVLTMREFDLRRRRGLMSDDAMRAMPGLLGKISKFVEQLGLSKLPTLEDEELG